MAFVNRILIADNSAEYGSEFAHVLSGCGFVVTTVRHDGATVLSALEQDCCDFAFIDDMLPERSAAEIISGQRGCSQRPFFFVVSPVESPSLERSIERFSDTRLLMSPFGYAEAARMVSMITPQGCGYCHREVMTELELLASRLLDKSLVPKYLNGYKYIARAAVLALLDPELRICVTKRLYPAVAAAFGTNGRAVERSMRHSIKTCCEENDREAITNSSCIKSIVATIEQDSAELLAELSRRE